MDAAEPLIEAMRDFSPNAEVLTNLTVFYLRQRDLPNALKTSESALKYFPNKSGLLYNYGQTLQFMGRCDDAAKAYRAAYLADRTMDFPKLPECVQ